MPDFEDPPIVADAAVEPLEAVTEDETYLELNAEESWRVGFDRWRRGIRLPVVTALAAVMCGAGVLSVVVLRSLGDGANSDGAKVQRPSEQKAAKPKLSVAPLLPAATRASKDKQQVRRKGRAARRRARSRRPRRIRHRSLGARPSLPAPQPVSSSAPPHPSAMPRSSPAPVGGAEEFSPER